MVFVINTLIGSRLALPLMIFIKDTGKIKAKESIDSYKSVFENFKKLSDTSKIPNNGLRENVKLDIH